MSQVASNESSPIAREFNLLIARICFKEMVAKGFFVLAVALIVEVKGRFYVFVWINPTPEIEEDVFQD